MPSLLTESTESIFHNIFKNLDPSFHISKVSEFSDPSPLILRNRCQKSLCILEGSENSDHSDFRKFQHRKFPCLQY